MLTLPMKFIASSTASSGISTPFEARSEDFDPIRLAIPHQFNGPGKAYSPEDLLALSLASCLIATFKVFAEKSQLSFERIEAHSSLTIDKVQGAIAISKIEIQLQLFGAQDREKATKLLGQTEKHCLVSNALKVEKQISYQLF